MPRFPRVFLTDTPLHIVQRGHDRQPVFVEPADFRYYLENIQEIKLSLGVDVHAYCLMTNHIHLLITPRRAPENVSTFMRIIAARQTRFVNKREARSGTLWEGRFKASLIDSEAYLLACQRYIELNPVRAGVVAAAGEYLWSSYCANSVPGSDSDWLDRHALYRALGPDDRERATRYRSFIDLGTRGSDTRRFREAIQRNQLTGGARFRQQIEARIGRRVSMAAPGRPRKVGK